MKKTTAAAKKKVRKARAKLIKEHCTCGNPYYEFNCSVHHPDDESWISIEADRCAGKPD